MANFIKPYNNDPFVGHLSTPVTTSAATKAFLDKLGPLRNSEIALLSGFLSAVGLITILTLCLTIYGKVSFQESTKNSAKLTNKDLLTEEGWAQFTSGFLVGAFGGAGFAYLTLLNLAL